MLFTIGLLFTIGMLLLLLLLLLLQCMLITAYTLSMLLISILGIVVM